MTQPAGEKGAKAAPTDPVITIGALLAAIARSLELADVLPDMGNTGTPDQGGIGIPLARTRKGRCGDRASLAAPSTGLMCAVKRAVK